MADANDDAVIGGGGNKGLVTARFSGRGFPFCNLRITGRMPRAAFKFPGGPERPFCPPRSFFAT